MYHRQKKWKDSLKTRAERAVLRAYIENQAILEPTLLFREFKRIQSPFWKHHVNVLLIYSLLYHLNDRPPSMFPLHLGVYIFLYARSKLMARPIPVLK